MLAGVHLGGHALKVCQRGSFDHSRHDRKRRETEPSLAAVGRTFALAEILAVDLNH